MSQETKGKRTGISRFEKMYWTTAVMVTAAVLLLWLIESILAGPVESFQEELRRIVGSLPTLAPNHQPSSEEILSSGAANELSALGREAARAVLERADALGGEEGARWLRALAFYTDRRLYSERIGRYLTGQDEQLAVAAAGVLGVAFDAEDRERNANAILSQYAGTEPTVKALLLLSLAHLSTEKGRETVLQELSADSDSLRLAACAALGLHTFNDGDGRIRRALEYVAEGDRSEKVRSAAAQALDEDERR